MNEKSDLIRVVLADNHAVVRKGIRDFWEKEYACRGGDKRAALFPRSAPDLPGGPGIVARA